MHEILHKNLNEYMFSFTFYANFQEILLCAIKATNLLQLYTANSLYAFNPFKMVQMLFSQI